MDLEFVHIPDEATGKDMYAIVRVALLLSVELAKARLRLTGRGMKLRNWRQNIPLWRSCTSRPSYATLYISRPHAANHDNFGQPEQIMLAPNESYCVSSLAALREVTHLKANMTKAQAEHVLGSFVARGWLVKSK